MSELKIVKPKQAKTAPTQEELRIAFEKVQNKEHWKGAINAVIDPADEQIVNAAICHFAYGGASFSKAAGGKLRVKAPGYWGMEAQLGG